MIVGDAILRRKPEGGNFLAKCSQVAGNSLRAHVIFLSNFVDDLGLCFTRTEQLPHLGSNRVQLQKAIMFYVQQNTAILGWEHVYSAEPTTDCRRARHGFRPFIMKLSR